jgi:phosphatidylglycerol---prolipoprotein diacylglyceryl transferase
MHPILFQLGSIPIYTYGVLVATGFLLGLGYATRQAPQAGLSPEFVWNLGVYAILIGLVSSKLWLLLSEWDYYAADPGRIFSIATFQSAGTFYGGILGALVWVVTYARIRKVALLAVLDVSAAPLALGHAIGRLGCFAAGCCYGKPTSLPWGVTFTSPVAARIAGTPLDVSLHPTQLYEAAAEFLNFLLLAWLGRRQKFSGQVAGGFFMLYGLERGAIEFLRADPGRTMMFHGALSLMQLVSGGLLVAGAWLWWRGLRSSAALPPREPTSMATGRS